MNDEAWMSLLGLAYRARKVVSGEELVIGEVRKRKVSLVLLSSDASENTVKKVTNKCTSYGVPLRRVADRESLGNAIGKPARVVVGVTDKGFGDSLCKRLDEKSRG
ncbi:YlxQ family RNA-binding protein [Bacillus fonticola]|uniref:YlxQ family RNA-binding protein n=1 Tax=Bacillus fonticola TaxID=2728853 RepID=UPI0014763462|nr:YlxQ family RNA-binding protein [Bacillus fonticola]